MLKLLKYLPVKGKTINDLPDLAKEILLDIRGTLPPQATQILDAYYAENKTATHQLKCQLDAEAKKGQALQCARGKADLENLKKLREAQLAARVKLLKNSSRGLKKQAKERGITHRNTNFNKSRINQNQLRGSYQDVNFKYQVNKSRFGKEFDPDSDASTIGNRAVLFDANGKVLRTANEINREGKAVDEAAKLATTSAARSLKAKARTQQQTRNLTSAIDKMKGTGEINSLASLFAAITGMVAVIALIAVLVPLSFLTVALNWLQTITTMLANIKDVATTYLSVTEAGLSLFGYPKATNKIKGYVNDVAYGIFGKKNYEEAKSAFAQGILNLTALTKTLEKIESGRRNTDSKIDGVAFQLGTANNIAKETGMIPPDSDWAIASKKVDEFVEKQAGISTDKELKENIQTLTSEIQTQEEVEKEIKEEAVAKEKIRVQKQKELDNLQKLGEGVKPLVDKAINEASE